MARLKRFQRDIELFKELYPNVKIVVEDLKITLPELNCILKFPLDWPFHQPLIMINDEIIASIKNWSMGMDLRSIYNFILNNDLSYDEMVKMKLIEEEIQKSEFFSEQIELFKKQFPKANIKYNDYLLSEFDITYENINVTISENGINVYEDKREWPLYMVPPVSLYMIHQTFPICSFNLISILDHVIKLRDQPDNNTNIEEIESSLRDKFDNFKYNLNHRTFIIDHDKGLIIVGIPKKNYLNPNIMIYRQGNILSVIFNLNDWNFNNDLGSIILTAEGF